MEFEALAGAAMRLVVGQCRAALADRGHATAGAGEAAGEGASLGEGVGAATAGRERLSTTPADVHPAWPSRRLFELVDEKLRGTYFSDVLARLCERPDAGDLAQSLQAALREMLGSDASFARAVGREVDQAYHMPSPPAVQADEVMVDQTSDASGSTVNIGTMKGGQFALGSIVNNRKVQISLGVGLPLVVLLVVLFALRRSGDESPTGGDERGAGQEDVASQREATGGDSDTSDHRPNTTTTVPTPSSGEVAWRWIPPEPLTQFANASFGDYTVIADFETTQLLVYDRVTGEELDARTLGDVKELEVVPYGTGEAWALAIYSSREVPADGLEPARVERRVELYTDPTAPAIYSADLAEEQGSFFTGSAHVVTAASSEESYMTVYGVETGEMLWQTSEYLPAGSTSEPHPAGRTTLEVFRPADAATTYNPGFILADTTGQVLAEIPEGGVTLAEPGTDVWEGYGQESTPTETVEYYFVLHGGERGPNIRDPDIYDRIDAKVEVESGVLIFSYPDRLVGYNSTTGEQLWTTEATLGGLQDGLIHLRQGGLVALRANEQVVVMDPATGEQLWTSGPGVPPQDELELVYDASSALADDGGPTIAGHSEGGGLVFWYVGDQLPVASYDETILLAP